MPPKKSDVLGKNIKANGFYACAHDESIENSQKKNKSFSEAR